MIKTVSLLAILTSAFLMTGCATMNDLWSSLNQDETHPALQQIKKAPRFSDNQNMGVPTDRSYRRMTKNRMEEESDLGSNAGSTWVMDGQGSYLFSQNKTRKEGDHLNVKLDAPALKQVETKVSVIKKLLKQLEEQQQQQNNRLNNTLAQNAGEASRDPASTAAATPAPAAAAAPEKEEDGLADVQSVPTRIVERMPDGNYRLKGQQPFMIGKREYKVLVTGLIRAEDFNDQGITSDKLLDPQYDVVSIRRNARNE